MEFSAEKSYTNTMKTKNYRAFTATPALRALIFGLALLITGPVFSLDADFSTVTDGMDNFAAQLADSLPLNSTMGLNWSNAYIGNFPHFGVGLTLGMTTIKADNIKSLLSTFKMDLRGLPDTAIPNPGYTVDGRIGGFALPFDVGFKVGYLPPIGADSFKLNYFLVGGDVRYALLKDSAVIPAVSVGFGVNYLAGGITAKVATISYDSAVTAGQTLSLNDPTLSFSWETMSFELKAQISKSLILFTPYAGLGLHYAKTRAGYKAETTVTYGGSDIKTDFPGVDFDGTAGFESFQEISGFGMRFFGGIAFNLAVIKLDIDVMAGTGNDFDFGNMSYGISLGLRLQI
jgi:hypothetical protein